MKRLFALVPALLGAWVLPFGTRGLPVQSRPEASVLPLQKAAVGTTLRAYGVTIKSVGFVAPMPSIASQQKTGTVPPQPPPPVLVLSRSRLSFLFPIGGGGPPAQSVTISNAGTGVLAWTASSSVPWLTVSPTSGTAPATISISLNPAKLEAGTFIGAVTVFSRGGFPQMITVNLTVLPNPNAPTIRSVVNGASFQVGFASGGWVTIQGSNLSWTTRTWRDDEIVGGQLPTALDGVRVYINRHPAFVYYISPTQINVQAPTDEEGGFVERLVEVEVIAPDGSARTQALKRRFAPGVFMFDPGGRRYVVAVHSDGTYVGAENLMPDAVTRPARPGDAVLLYTTGMGWATYPEVPAGQVVTAPAVLLDRVEVSIGGAAAEVSFAGLVGAGVYQINLTVPDVLDGDQAVLVQIAGVRSQDGAFITIRR